MKLDKLQIDILKGVRTRLEEEQSGADAYLCFKINDETKDRARKEVRLLRNRFLFWRKYLIHEKWYEQDEVLRRAIHIGIRGRSTMGTWFDMETAGVGINITEGYHSNTRLYKWIRLAWLDRILETGEIK